MQSTQRTIYWIISHAALIHMTRRIPRTRATTFVRSQDLYPLGVPVVSDLLAPPLGTVPRLLAARGICPRSHTIPGDHAHSPHVVLNRHDNDTVCADVGVACSVKIVLTSGIYIKSFDDSLLTDDGTEYDLLILFSPVESTSRVSTTLFSPTSVSSVLPRLFSPVSTVKL